MNPDSHFSFLTDIKLPFPLQRRRRRVGAAVAAGSPRAAAKAPASVADAMSVLHTTLESSRDGVMAVDLSGHILFYNARFADLWRLPAELLLSRSEREVHEHIAGQLADRSHYLQCVALSEFDPASRATEVFELRDGRVFERHVAPQRTGRHCVGMVTHWREVTEHRQLHQALVASESSHSRLLASMSDGVFVARDGRFVFANAALPRMLGYTPETFAGLPFERVVAPEFLELWNYRFAQRVSGDEAEPRSSYRLRFLCQDGLSSVWVDLHASRIDYEGQASVLGIVCDVTELRRTEQRDQLRDHVLDRLARGAKLDGVLHAIVFGTEEMVPEARCAVLLLNSRGTRLTVGAAPSLPDFLVGALDGLSFGAAAAHCGLATAKGEPLVLDDVVGRVDTPAFARFVGRSGVHTSWSETIVGPSGRVLGTFVAYLTTCGVPCKRDVELLRQAASLAGLAIERRRAEEELQLASLVYQTSTEAMMVMDARDRVLAINPAFGQITGYSAEEVIGADASAFHEVSRDPGFYRGLRRALDAGGQWQGELWCRRKNGELFIGLVKINTDRNADGEVQRRVVMFSDITNRKQSEALIWRQANYDILTQLPNRGLLQDRLASEIRKAEHTGQRLALLSIDLDKFQEINESLGHEKGDRLLVEAARRIGQGVGSADSVARMGADEFVAVIPGLALGEEVAPLARRLLEQLAAPYDLGQGPTVVNASIGLAIYPDDARSPESLITHATQAMHVAKDNGGNQSSFFTPALQEAAQKRSRLVHDLRRAVAEQQFRLHFQPITDLRTGRIHKAEALLRWEHPERGMVLPGEFIALAEETRLIVEIGDWAFKEAARWAGRWRAQHDAGFQVSVNKSPVQFEQEGVAEGWLGHLRALGLPPESLSIEITEGLLLRSEPQIAAAMNAYREAGVQLAIDDFGTGYSALSYLKKFDIDCLKIDQAFVRNLASDASDRALCEAMIVMAHRLGLKVVAEGVETEAQRSILLEIGCDYGQGYLFARPAAPEAFEARLEASRAHAAR